MARLLDLENSSLEAARQYAAENALYAILDACDAPSVPMKIHELGEERAVSLYRGMAEEEFSSFAPYLVHADASVLDWIHAALWQEPWGIFVTTDVPLAALRSHFRRFLIVDDPQGEQMYFRFYDPRVLRKFLPACNAGELREFFGTVERFLTVEGKDLVSCQMAKPVRAQYVPAGSRRIGERFVVREEVMAAFSEEADAAFEQRLIKHLRERHKDLVEIFSDEDLLPMVRTGIRRARRYGMTWESNLTAYVALMFEIAPNFDRHPRMQMILANRQIPPEERIHLLVERTPDTVWEEVDRRYDASAWFDSEPERNTADA